MESKLISEIKGVPSDFYSITKYKLCSGICLPRLSSIIEICDKDYGLNKNIVKSILEQCFIRASMVYMSDYEVYQIIEDFYRYTVPFIKSKQNIKNDISLSIVKDCFNKKKEDKNKIKIVSLYNKN